MATRKRIIQKVKNQEGVQFEIMTPRVTVFDPLKNAKFTPSRAYVVKKYVILKINRSSQEKIVNHKGIVETTFGKTSMDIPTVYVKETTHEVILEVKIRKDIFNRALNQAIIECAKKAIITVIKELVSGNLREANKLFDLAFHKCLATKGWEEENNEEGIGVGCNIFCWSAGCGSGI